MSSTGNPGRRVILPTTGFAEQHRQTEAAISSYPGLHEGIREAFGTITEVHPEKPMIVAHDDSGSKISNGSFIPLAHGTLEIAERWGTIRRGMRIRVQYSGPDGSNSFATIIGLEGERNVNTPFESNEAEQGLSKIFAPGIGIG